jgi:hypothetical protein
VTGSTESPKLTPAERRRRRARRAWIPTGIVAVLIVAAIIVALVIQRQGDDKTIVEQAGDSTFDKAGVAEIVRTADVQIDVRGSQKASPLALPADGAIKLGPFSNIAAEVDLVGTSGTEQLFVDSFTVTTKDDYVSTVTTRTKEYDYTDLHSKLVELKVVGISTTQMAAFLNAMPVGAGGPDSYFQLDVGTGTSLGVPTDVTVKCAGPAGCTIRTTTTLARK